jgi:hypothetical protein
MKLLQVFDVVFLPLVASGCYRVANLQFGLKLLHFLDLPAFARGQIRLQREWFTT